jgi:hypothetical protein
MATLVCEASYLIGMITFKDDSANLSLILKQAPVLNKLDVSVREKSPI